MTRPSQAAIDRAGRIVATDRAMRDRLPAAEVARRAHYFGGPSVEDLTERVTADRIARGLPLEGTDSAV